MSTTYLLVIKGVFKMADSKLKTLFLDFARYLGEKDAELARLVSATKVITGTGSPEGKVVADKDVTYIDTNRTLGAYKWVKTTAGGNTGWKVIEGDTGWVEITRATNRSGTNIKVWIRRINDRITWKFGGGQHDWYSIIGPENTAWQGNPFGNIARTNKSAKIWHSYVCPPSWNLIPVGFRSPSSLIGQFYSDLTNKAYGVWKLGGIHDKNQFRFEFFDQADARKDIADIRIDTVTYLTDDPWPTAFQ
jgi:hypothetical protein